MSKYRNKKVKIGDLKFDSQIEYKYYNQLVWLKKSNGIKDFELQPEFILQPSFKHNGKTIRAIKYVADFKVINNDGTIEYIDTKGKLTEVFRIKKKMFHKVFPELTLKCLWWDDLIGWYEKK